MNITWNADKYTSDFSFVYKYGEGVTELLELPRNSLVIDLGCGNGALSGLLREKGFRVVGMDASAEQLALAKRSFPDISFIQADATDFTAAEPAEAVFSNAVFHWIDREKQPDMLSCIHRALKPGGQLVFEMGGHGNCGRIHKALAEQFEKRGSKYVTGKFFPTIGEYSALLEQAGFEVRYATLFERPTELKGDDGAAGWIEMFAKNAFRVITDENERREIIRSAADSLRGELFRDGKWYADYVRLRMKAVKPAE